MRKSIAKLLTAFGNSGLHGDGLDASLWSSHSRGKGGKQGAKKPSGVAASKRSAKKLSNIRKRKSK